MSSGGWNTIESDAGVFTYLLENLGVKDVQFEELLSLDPHELAALAPVYGIIFLFKFPTNAPYVGEDGAAPHDGQFDHDADSLFFARQTIQNACGTQALLSVLLNQQEVDIGSHLQTFREFAMALPADLRGEALSNDELIRDVHNSFAKSSPFVDETQRPPHNPEDAEDVYHFIAYTAVAGRLYELDGLQPAPIDHGPVDASSSSSSTQAFAEAALAAVQRRITRYGADEIHFNLLAAVRDRRLLARTIGDTELLAREARKRRAWQFENALRRHNFVGFAHEVLEGVVEAKLREGGAGAGGSGQPASQTNTAAYDRWVADATARIQRRVQEKQRRGVPLGQDVHVEE